uniref:Biogenesis of lysosome-related organelles complex 1 subunit 5 n=1 Tax=Neolamprologus brichardi TaxID=32507 RepID=A0A3Q4GDV2_NEOBR
MQTGIQIYLSPLHSATLFNYLFICFSGKKPSCCLERGLTCCAVVQEKRGYRESRLLENINKSVLETNEQMSPANFEDMKHQLSDINKRLEAANHMAERVQQRELEAQQGTRLKANMEQLKEDWAEFLKEQQRLKEEVDEEHARAVGQLSAKYNEKKKELAKFTL